MVSTSDNGVVLGGAFGPVRRLVVGQIQHQRRAPQRTDLSGLLPMAVDALAASPGGGFAMVLRDLAQPAPATSSSSATPRPANGSAASFSSPRDRIAPGRLYIRRPHRAVTRPRHPPSSSTSAPTGHSPQRGQPGRTDRTVRWQADQRRRRSPGDRRGRAKRGLAPHPPRSRRRHPLEGAEGQVPRRQSSRGAEVVALARDPSGETATILRLINP